MLAQQGLIMTRSSINSDGSYHNGDSTFNISLHPSYLVSLAFPYLPIQVSNLFLDPSSLTKNKQEHVAREVTCTRDFYR
jgi:hypothetical protein